MPTRQGDDGDDGKAERLLHLTGEARHGVELASLG
jgi:hypothetical protein